jgi:deoxyadenosine/deoxycytidine kinase
MQVIIEGPDGAGKTSISLLVAEALAATRIKATVLHDDLLTRDVAYEELKAMYYSPLITIYDRWYYPSDTIYNPIVADKPSAFSPTEIVKIENNLNRVGALVIIVTADISILTERVGARGDDYIQSHHIPDIYHGYQDFIEYTTLPYVVVDTTDITVVDAVLIILKQIHAFYYERFGVHYEGRNNSTN